MKNNTYPLNNYTQTYTTNRLKLSHNQLKALKTWWKQLSQTWKQIFLANLEMQKKYRQDYSYFHSPWDTYMKSFNLVEDIDNHTLNCIVSLTEINCNYTQINTLTPLTKLKNLKEVRCIGSNISSLQDLEKLADLEVLICFDTPILRKERRKFNQIRPNCLILY